MSFTLAVQGSWGNLAGEGDIPDSPTLVLTALEDGSGILATISNYTAGATNTLYLAVRNGGWVSYGSTWVEDTMTIALGTTGVYYGNAISVVAGCSNISNVARVVFEGTDDDAADDNIAFVNTIMKASAVYWPPADDMDEFGKPVPQDPVVISCRWEEVLVEIIDAQGDKRMSKATIYADRDLKRGGILLEGTFDDVSDYENPKENEGAEEIIKVTKLPNVRGNKYLRQAYL